MKKEQIKVGGTYLAKVNGRVVPCRVDEIRDGSNRLAYGGPRSSHMPIYHVTNLATGRKTTFRSAQKFRGLVGETAEQIAVREAKEKADAKFDRIAAAAVAHDKRQEEAEHRRPFAATAVADSQPPADATVATPPEPPNQSTSTSSTPLAGLLQRSLDHLQKHGPDGETVAGYSPTPEQREVLRAAVTPGLKCLVMPAGAGAGKTSTLKMLEQVLPGRGQYTAFNRSLVAESKSKFKKARCSTTHGLAFGTAGKRFAHRLNGARMRSEQVAARLGLADMEVSVAGADGQPGLRKLAAGFLAGQVMVAVRQFCQSADERIERRHFKRIEGIDAAGEWGNNETVRGYLLPFAERAWADLSSPDGGLPFSHDVYVKVWQLGKGPDRPHIPADYILLDEAQDTAPVFLDVLKQQTHALLIFVGDSNQAIYEWRGAVDAMAAFPDAPRRMLSQSFRFGQRIADVANSILEHLQEPTDLDLKGLEALPSVVRVQEPTDHPRCVLTRTNAAAIGAVMAAQNSGKKAHLIASVDEVLAFVRAAQDLQRGKATSHPELGCFSTWSEVVEHSKTDEGQELRLWVRLIEEFTCERIVSALSGQVPEDQADLVVCTAHKSKGREWRSVKLAADFRPVCKMDDAEVRLLYVAATRAKAELDLSECPPFLPFVDKVIGEESPGIRIKFTGPMPKAEEWPEDEQRSDPSPTDGTEETRKKKPSAPTSAGATDSNGETNGRSQWTFHWTNYNGRWCVAGPSGQAGKEAEVARKNGSKSVERLGAVVKEFPERCIYELKK